MPLADLSKGLRVAALIHAEARGHAVLRIDFCVLNIVVLVSDFARVV